MLYNPQQLQFFMSTDAPCPYLEDQRERKLFTSLEAPGAEAMQNALSQQGFRRSQNILYKPVCQNCGGCLSARVITEEFKHSKNHKRIMTKNRDIIREVRKAESTEEQFELFERYVKSRHQDGGMADMSIFDFSSMIDQSHVPTRLIEYRILRDGRPAELIAASLTDVLRDGLSMVYSFFDPDEDARSLGTYMVLDHINICKQSELDYLYLGYWVNQSSSMSYKARFQPLELNFGESWKRFDEVSQKEPPVQNSQKVLLRALRTLAMQGNNMG